MAEQQLTRARRIGRPVRAAWLIVLVLMLAADVWSISGKLAAWGMNEKLAWGLSLMFDLAGLICTEYARRVSGRAAGRGSSRVDVPVRGQKLEITFVRTLLMVLGSRAL
ncbi:hypothetical protein [Streptomyces xantholiticus]|uniref:hypothetical protein n=1 Tax=Streptomyces xantholiticus TaxID=68285 RepID=UPI0016772287|nr:hypothetical protein [Streptomyces xantholiticus]GGW69987.1 hypothetical protein GCM10010381_63510 [Streptomyces xantholiticus]